jgi:rhodanese-related sulfurtransferase
MFGFLRPSPSGRLSLADAITRAAAGELVLIDVREAGEIRASGKAKGAVALPMATLAMKADPQSPECAAALKSGKPIAIYCASGGRSGMATQALKKMGHAEVHNIGGFGDWVKAGGPVDR